MKKNGFNITKVNKNLKTVDSILAFSNVAAYVIGGKIKFLILISILLVTYAIYIRFYPYIYIETRTKKEKGTAFQMPLTGAFIAMFSCLIVSKNINCGFVNIIKIAFCLTAILAVPYIIKSLRTECPQRLGRKASVILAVLAISFSIVLPLNIVLTFDKPVHETVSITDKDVNTGDNANSYFLYGNWKGEEAEFSVSRSTYKETSIGDVKKICIRKSVLGLEYYTIHK
ncbi:MAG: hypothetical protein ACLRTF_06030 [Blautia sp.]